jgi:hypothetical protein
MAILRIDRLEVTTAELAAAIERLDPEPLVPTVLAAPVKFLRQVLRFDLPARAKAEVLTSLRRLPEAARSDPARADALAAWAVHVIAWLTDQTDLPPPPLELGRPSRSSPGSAGATGASSSAGPDPASQPSPG